jgi:hypothetical protein
VVLELHLLDEVAVMVVLVRWSGHFEPKHCVANAGVVVAAEREARKKSNSPDPDPEPVRRRQVLRAFREHRAHLLHALQSVCLCE